MDENTLLNQLEELAERLDISVRYETTLEDFLLSHGGLCRLKDRYVIIVNKDISAAEKAKTLGLAIARFDLDTIYIRPGLRAFLSGFRGERQ
ncbi:MAG: hypothetical protein WAL98_01535 [Desulfatiglandaceae bacterium]|jgi:hypothetical protein